MVSLSGSESGLNCVGRAKMGRKAICAVGHQPVLLLRRYHVACGMTCLLQAFLTKQNTKHGGLKVCESCEEAGFREWGGTTNALDPEV